MQLKLKATQPLPVRFTHAPCVKLTLADRPAAFPRAGVRVLRLEKMSGNDR